MLALYPRQNKIRAEQKVVWQEESPQTVVHHETSSLAIALCLNRRRLGGLAYRSKKQKRYKTVTRGTMRRSIFLRMDVSSSSVQSTISPEESLLFGSSSM